MGAASTSHDGKSRIRSLAKPDGSFSWIFSDAYERRSALSTPIDLRKYSLTYDIDLLLVDNAVAVNGINIDMNDVEFWNTIFSDDFIQKLDLISISCDSERLRFLLPHLRRLCRPSLIPCKPFNFCWASHWPYSGSAEENIQLMSVIASFIRQNRLVTIQFPHILFSYTDETKLEIFLEPYIDIVNAIAITHSLISMEWYFGIVAKLELPQRPAVFTQMAEAMLAALEKNTSLTKVVFFSDAGLLGWDDVITPLLSRNKALPTMNAAIAAGKVDGEWDGSCPSDIVRDLIAAKFNIHRSFFNTAGDMCFCESCHKKSGNTELYTRGDPPFRYVPPVGWMRLGLKVHEGFAESNDIFRKWHVSYHGTTANNLESIFRGGLQLLKPGDVALGGTALSIRPGHIRKPIRRTNLYTGLEEEFDINQIFTSPSIRYSSHPAYAHQFVIDHPRRTGVRIGMRFVFQCRQRPGSYQIGHETVGAGSIKLDPHFDNKELEWYTKENAGIVLCGLCVQLRYVN